MCLGHRSSDQQKTGVKPTHMRHAESTFRWMGAEWASQCETTRCGVDRHRFLGRKQNRFGSELNVAHAYLSRRCWPLKFLNCSTPIPTFGHHDLTRPSAWMRLHHTPACKTLNPCRPWSTQPTATMSLALVKLCRGLWADWFKDVPRCIKICRVSDMASFNFGYYDNIYICIIILIS